MFFWWLNLVRLYSLYKILYPKRRIQSYSILGTIVSPNKILLTFHATAGLGLRVGFLSFGLQGLRPIAQDFGA